LIAFALVVFELAAMATSFGERKVDQNGDAKVADSVVAVVVSMGVLVAVLATLAAPI
jgi:hypothetical protein